MTRPSYLPSTRSVPLMPPEYDRYFVKHLTDRLDAVLAIEPEHHATKSRDYGRGFAEAVRLVREAVATGSAPEQNSASDQKHPTPGTARPGVPQPRRPVRPRAVRPVPVAVANALRAARLLPGPSDRT